MVLAYHEVVPEKPSYLYGVTCDQLRQHLMVVKAREGDPARPPVRVSFDDGHISHYRHAVPLLEAARLRAVFFVTAGWTGEQPEYMNVAQLRELVALGHQVQAHGWSHKMLTLCTPSELYRELRQAREVLEDCLGVAVDSLSAPHGRWNRRVLDACAAAGYKNLYISEPPAAPADLSGMNLFGRVMMTHRLSAKDLEARIHSGDRPGKLARLKSAVKRPLRAMLGDRRYHELWRIAADPRGTVKLHGHSEQEQAAPDRTGRTTRILQLTSTAGYYGAESMLVNLAKALNAEDCDNVIAVFRHSKNPHTELVDRAREMGLKAEIIHCEGRLDWKAVRTIRALMDQHGIDLVHAHSSKANFYASVAAAPRHTPLVATYHLDWPDRGAALYCYHLLDRVLLRRFRRVVAVSEAIGKSLHRAGLNGSKVCSIANGIDVAPFVRAAADPSPAQTGSRIVIGVVGRLTPQKGHAYLLQAAPEILREYPAAVFLFAGDGPERQQLETVARSLGVEGHVIFAGARSDMPAVYASIDILVLPSVNEGMPMTLIEALAARKPVVASNVGDVSKLIQNGKTGLLVEPGDPAALRAAILRLLGDQQLRETVAAHGQQWACDNFSAAGMARRYRAVYDEVLDEAARSA